MALFALYRQGLAYKKKAPELVPSYNQRLTSRLLTEVLPGTEVSPTELEQWFLKITAYADRLLEDLAPRMARKVKTMQKLIGPYSSDIVFTVKETGDELTVLLPGLIPFLE